MGGVILMYHRIADTGFDPYGLAVHPDRFAAHIDSLKQLDCVVPLREIVADAGRPSVALTFDDGYADNAHTAAPIVDDAGIPATYFVTTGDLGGQVFWWDALASLLLGEHELPSGVDVNVGGRDIWLSLQDADARRRALRFVHRRLAATGPDELSGVLEELAQRLGSPTSTTPDGSGVTVDQLRTLAALPSVEVGAHTRNHVRLADQGVDQQRDEIDGSVRDLEALIGRAVRSFAYPFGGPGSVGDVAPRLVQEAGCDVACTTEIGVVSRRSDPYRLPRMNVGDWSGAEFSARLQQALAGCAQP